MDHTEQKKKRSVERTTRELHAARMAYGHRVRGNALFSRNFCRRLVAGQRTNTVSKQDPRTKINDERDFPSIRLQR